MHALQTVGVLSLGCAKNRVDSEQMLGLLRGWGYRITNDPAEAEILIVNTCGFIDPAKQESIDTLLEMADYKHSGRCRLLVATGCLVQRYADALREELPEVDAFLGVGEYERLQALLRAAEAGERPVACARSMAVFEGARVLTTPGYTAFLRTGDGCDNRCAYCAIPLIRGAYRSRPFDHVMAEARGLIAGGVKEITYIAQDTTRFGDDLPGGERLADLLRQTARIDGVRWVRALYCYPSRVDDRLLDTLAATPGVCPYLDVPLQHIDADLLRAMHRQGTPDDIYRLLEKARARGLTLRTTMIVGFPGETDAAFERLLRFVAEARFDRLGAFAYSAEEGTPAADLPGQLPEEVKAERLDRLMRLQQGISLAANERRVGTEAEALLERREGGIWTARTALEAPEGDGALLLRGGEGAKPGDFVRARIDGAGAYDLMGEILA
ncbi:MAG: 30S ribosomal protein S12 methylthiotransferase RimO [Oscillospiraceae bacterium]|jgi:ribosomal protein S12 methylthiotransferase|nr:30S ribosomal protein S12 methylthiotransferase RimO [Oscillospiraceae bacterium]